MFRLARLIVIALVVSVLVQLFVTLLFSMVVPHPRVTIPDSPLWPVEVPPQWEGFGPADDTDSVSGYLVERVMAYSGENAVVAKNKTVMIKGVNASDDIYVAERLSVGFPFKSLYSWRFKANGQEKLTAHATLRGVSVVGVVPTSASLFERDIPIRVAWSGLAINVLLVAIVIVIVVMAIGMLRRAIRIRSQRCPVCAYSTRDLQSSMCPECGFVFSHQGHAFDRT